ncbi:MAG: TCR/Tet family MFS transporter [Stappiaceae bacterium]
MSEKKSSRLAISFILITVVLDSIGIGLIIPVMPQLIEELTGDPINIAAEWGGLLTFIYALMQFVFGPTVGNLSDRFGRRPILLVSLLFLSFDYLIMALAPTILLLLVGRTLAGIAGANFSTANAYIADVSPPEKRSQNFGLIGAAFGMGFIIGPVIGGFLGEYGARAPFYAAALLALVNAAYGWLVLPESLPKEDRRAFDWRRANPFGALKQLRKVPVVAGIMMAAFLFDIAHFVYPAVWSYYTVEMFNWSSAQIGLSLAAVGVGFAVVQGWLIRIIVPKFGESKTLIFALLMNVISLVWISFSTEGWMIFAIIPLTSLGALAGPAFSGIMSQQLPQDEQGELQGLISSKAGLATIISPLMMTQLFGHFAGDGAPIYFPGAPFFAAALLVTLSFLTVVYCIMNYRRKSV